MADIEGLVAKYGEPVESEPDTAEAVDAEDAAPQADDDEEDAGSPLPGEPEEDEDEEDLPEKFRGKSRADIARMALEAEKAIGKQGTELADLRRQQNLYGDELPQINVQDAARNAAWTEYQDMVRSGDVPEYDLENPDPEAKRAWDRVYNQKFELISMQVRMAHLERQVTRAVAPTLANERVAPVLRQLGMDGSLTAEEVVGEIPNGMQFITDPNVPDDLRRQTLEAAAKIAWFNKSHTPEKRAASPKPAPTIAGARTERVADTDESQVPRSYLRTKLASLKTRFPSLAPGDLRDLAVTEYMERNR